MKNARGRDQGDARLDSIDRRDFCKKAIKRSSIAAAAGVAGYLAYKKPKVRSFFGVREAYANSSVAMPH